MDSPSPASLRRLEIARQIFPVYAANSNVLALFVAGSVARGWADESSDMEVTIICAKAPTNAERQWCARQTGGRIGRFEGYNPAKWTWPEEVYIEGIKLDMAWITPESVNSILTDVIDRHDTHFNKQVYCAIIRRAVVLHGADVMSQWQAKTACYPDGLMEAIVRQNIFFERAAMRRLLVARDDLPLLAEHDTYSVRKLILLWLAINGEFYSGFKWTRQVIGSLSVAPRDAFPRIVNIFRCDPATGGEELRGLIRDTFDLVEQRLPQVNVQQAKVDFESD
jgi:hypothetical protein